MLKCIIVVILTIMSMIQFVLSWVEHDNCIITSGPAPYIVFMHSMHFETNIGLPTSVNMFVLMHFQNVKMCLIL